MGLRRRQLASAVIPGAIIAITEALAIVLDSDDSDDGRSHRRPASRRFSMRQSFFYVADNDSIFDEGWFRNQFRCSKASFDRICGMIEANWHICHEPLGHNAVFLVRDRTAVTMFYLTHPGSLSEAASVFGMSKTTALRSVKQIVDVLVSVILPQIIRLPQCDQDWSRLIKGFENICGFPDCCLAVDGSIFEIERPYDYDGWYCRKGFPALNIQLVVDHKARVRSVDIRPGSANDKAVFNYSHFGTNLAKTIPAGKHIVADAGYTLSDCVMIPYPVVEFMDPEEAWYNYLHSRTRITVERAIGMIKNRFRIFKVPLNQKADDQEGRTEAEEMSRVVAACLVLHNILIDLQDPTDIIAGERSDQQGNQAEEEAEARRPNADSNLKRDQIKEYLQANKAFKKANYD